MLADLLRQKGNAMIDYPVIRPASGGDRPDIPALTGLRFFAAFSVVVAHGTGQLLKFAEPPTLIDWLSWLSGFGMTLFFVLSGFVIHYNYRRKVTEQGLDGVAGFMWARFARLYPLYLVMLVLDVLLGRKLMVFVADNADGFQFQDVLRSLPYYLLLVQSWFYVPFGDSSLIYVTGLNISLSWSISTEWFFYISYPVVALLVLRVRRPAVILGCMLAWSVMWSALASGLDGRTPEIDGWAVNHFGAVAGFANGEQDSFVRWLLYFSPYLRIGEFILGCLVAQLYLQLRDQAVSGKEQAIGMGLLIIALLSVLAVLYLTYESTHSSTFFLSLRYNFGMAPSVAVILFCAARYENFVSRFLRDRRVVALGEASYSIYLIHFLIFILISGYLGQTLPVTGPSIVFLGARFVFALCVIMLVALGLHAFLEVPARSWLRGLWSDKPGAERRRVALAVLASPAAAAVLVVVIANAVFPAMAPVAAGIRLIAATYGGNCGAKVGNVTRALSRACDGKETCDYRVDVATLGDPAGGCAKAFTAQYACAPDQARFTKDIPGEAGLGSRLLLSCTANSTAAASLGAPLLLPPASSDLPDAVTANTIAVPANAIKVRSATYGGNCGAPTGNATSDVQLSCDGDRKCTYTVDVERLGDPAPNCAKAFALEYECAAGGDPLKVEVAGEAGLGKSVDLQCWSNADNAGPSPPAPIATRPASAAASSARGIGILSATYGGNCGAPAGNATEAVASACGGTASCNYAVDVNKLGDPAPRCAKSFFVKFRCGGDSATRSTAVRGEAGLGSLIHLACP
jgi:peptidoglycan/LPS O-acetylase OafA/YrhL